MIWEIINEKKIGYDGRWPLKSALICREFTVGQNYLN